MERFDFIILGAGAAAFAGAIKANELGAKTAMIRGPLPVGGTCVNVGCVPSKDLINAAKVAFEARHRKTPGVHVSLQAIDFPEIVRAERHLVAALRRQKYEKVLAQLPHVTLIEGEARFTNEKEVVAGKRTLTAPRFLIATGSTVHSPPIEGLAEVGYLTHVSALTSDRLPESLVVIGGGPLGLEFAQLYARFGSKVTLLVKDEQLFPRSEPELSRALEAIFTEEGIIVEKGVRVTKVEQRGTRKVLTVSGRQAESYVEVEEILLATGKTPNTKGLGLESVDVALDERGRIIVSPTLKASVPSIFAAGDVTNLPLRLEPTAGREGSLAAENALRGTKRSIDYRTVPWTVFTDPQLAGVGLLDAEVSTYGLSCTCNTVSFSEVAKAHILGDTRGIIKTVMDRKTRQVVGVHLLAENAGDLIGQAELILKNKMTVDEILETLPVFPTLSESIKIGALSLVMDISKLSCCV